MKRITSIIALVMVVLLGPNVSHGLPILVTNSEEIKTSIKSVITDQIKAFEVKDEDRAYYHASTAIKLIFKNSGIFCNMVKNSYPMIWAPKSYQFLETAVYDGKALQRMMFTDSVGDIHFFDYAMEPFEKRWVIAGVFPVSQGSGA